MDIKAAYELWLDSANEDEDLINELKGITGNDEEIYERFYREGERPRISRTPVYPDEWKNQFGVSVEEHKRSLSINTFSDYTIFGVRDTAPKQRHSDSSNNQENNYGYEH